MTELTEVTLSEYSGTRALHLGSPWIQGTMRIKAPLKIDLEYVQRMMVWLLFHEPDSITTLHAVQLGLGAGALSKACFNGLGMTTTAIEINPQVVRMCEQWFKLPKSLPKSRFQVIVADAGVEIAKAQWVGSVDTLQVDLYDHDAAGPVLDTVDFYQDCRRALTSTGVMTVNLFGGTQGFAGSIGKIQEAFGEQQVWTFKPTREGNTVVVAHRALDWRTVLLDRPRLVQRAQIIESRWNEYGLPAMKWINCLPKTL